MNRTGILFTQTSFLFSVLLAQMMALSLVFSWSRTKKIDSQMQLPSSVGIYARVLVVLLSVSSTLVTFYRWPRSPPTPYHPGPRMLTAGIWTLHFGMDNEGRDSQRRVRDLIQCVYIYFFRVIKPLTTNGKRYATRHRGSP